MVSVSFLVNCSKTKNEQVLTFCHLFPIESGHRIVPSAHFAEPDSAGLRCEPPGALASVGHQLPVPAAAWTAPHVWEAPGHRGPHAGPAAGRAVTHPTPTGSVTVGTLPNLSGVPVDACAHTQLKIRTFFTRLWL